jgi:hypothetical protein
MTRKQLILQMIERLPENVSFDRVIYHLTVMKKIEIGLEQAERGEGIEHEAFMKQLQAEEWLESESSGRPPRKKTSAKSGAASPGTRPKRQARSSGE